MQAQSRQSDSLKNKQLAYNRYLKEEAEKKAKAQQLALAKKNAAVVMYDSKGNRIESSVTKDGSTVTTTTILLPPVLNRKFNVDTINTDSVFLKVMKAKNRLQVYYRGKILTAYKCVFGPNHLDQKQCEGDRRTPEGTFTIQTCKDHLKWDKFMLLDYPNEESRRIFEENKRKGVIPKCATIGGLVGIHGIWPYGDNVIEMKHNWTDGCVSLKNADVEELAKIVKPGVTKITIVR
jgi:hypothetical protein